jgi:hypothetical protein
VPRSTSTAVQTETTNNLYVKTQADAAVFISTAEQGVQQFVVHHPESMCHKGGSVMGVVHNR